MIEITREVDDFRFCTLSREPDHVKVLAQGKVICPGQYGGWSGHLAWCVDHYEIEFDNEGARSAPCSVFFNEQKAKEYLADLQCRAEDLQQLIEARENMDTQPKPKILGFAPHLCPICGGKVTGTCRCMRGDSVCENGHSWHRCVKHQVLVEGDSDHGLDTDACTCGQGD